MSGGDGKNVFATIDTHFFKSAEFFPRFFKKLRNFFLDFSKFCGIISSFLMKPKKSVAIQ